MVDKLMLQKLKETIISRQALNQNKCGITIIFLINELNIDSDEIKKLLNELHAQKIIRIRQGINHKLIFLRS
jgi:hypothetical protein